MLGTTYYGRWQNGHPAPVPLVEVCAFQQDTASQVAVTAVHELAHAVALKGAGHGREWKRIARRLGLAAPAATSSGRETWESFTPAARTVLEAIPVPTDGKPLPPAPQPVGVAGAPLLALDDGSGGSGACSVCRVRPRRGVGARYSTLS